MVDKQIVRTHQEPAWRSKANYAALVKLQDFEIGNVIMYEQLALEKLESGLYKLCCIPFHVYVKNAWLAALINYEFI